jgi:hypothetical protein
MAKKTRSKAQGVDGSHFDLRDQLSRIEQKLDKLLRLEQKLDAFTAKFQGGQCQTYKLAPRTLQESSAKADPATSIDVDHLGFITKLEQLIIEYRTALQRTDRTFYTVEEFAILVERSQRTIRDWVKVGKTLATRAVGSGQRGKFEIPLDQLEPALKSIRRGHLTEKEKADLLSSLHR